MIRRFPMQEETMFVDCPECGVRMEIIRKTGKVIKHWEKLKKKVGGDAMRDALLKMSENKSKLDKYFSGAGQSMQEKKAELLQKFEQEKKRIHDEGDTSR